MFLLFPLLLFSNSAGECFGQTVTPWKSTTNRLVHDILESYDKKVKPTRSQTDPIVVTFSMELDQIIDVNEPHQYVLINAWIIERWRDELLYWDPSEYENIEEIMLPHDVLWLPDTTLYNTLIMKSDDERRLMNAKLVTNTTDKSVYIELLYPTIYKFSCLLNIYYFPFDSQICRMTFGSWTYDKMGIDYVPYSDHVGNSSFLENVGWSMKEFKAIRHEQKYACCPNNYTNLYLTLHVKRKPLYYMVNLIIPTCIITLISIIGFFTPSAATGERSEKISLGITTLLSMSILLLMISDQMPTTSTFVPLIGWFFLSMIILISAGTVMSSVIISVQKMGLEDEHLSPRVVRIACRFSRLSFTRIPDHIRKDECSKTKSTEPRLRLLSSHETSLIHQSDSVSPLLLSPVIANDKHHYEAANSLERDDNAISSFKSCVIKQRKATEAVVDEKTWREMVKREYDWLATVMERWSFFLFSVLFLIVAFGINAIGLIHWKSS